MTDRSPSGEIRTARLRLRFPQADDLKPLVALLADPAVARWWPGYDEDTTRRKLIESRADEGVRVFVIEQEGAVIGAVELYEQADPDYRHAGIDLFLDAARHGHGLGQEVLRAVTGHLGAHGHHRVVVDPAADNAAAIRAFEKAGFRRVGVMRQYERGPDGRRRDNLLMELLIEPAAATE
jgi:aminoglycoside 6'-N-acetyltransferase